MLNLINLMSVVSVENTLIIACGADRMNNRRELIDRVFIYFLRDHMLHSHDPVEKGRIQHFIEYKKCTQIIFLSTLEPSLISDIQKVDSRWSALRFGLGALLNDQEQNILSSACRDQLLVELHVITQCRLLMEYYFVKERVQKGQLHISGYVALINDEHLKPIFYNGITFNDLISSN